MRGRNRDAFEKYGNVFFVTFTTVGFIHIFSDPPYCDIMTANLQFYQGKGDFTVLAYVIMPNHVHLVVEIADSKTISQCIGNLKRITSRQISSRLQRTGNESLIARLREVADREPADDCRIWKPRFDCFTLHNTESIRQKIEYIHNNPIKAGLAAQAIDWQYSSAAAYAGLSETGVSVDSDWVSLGYDRLRSGKGS